MGRRRIRVHALSIAAIAAAALAGAAAARQRAVAPVAGNAPTPTAAPSPAAAPSSAAAPTPAPLPGPAAAPTHAANLAHGKALSYTCLGCHGVDGYKNAYPMYSVPKLEGQHPEYLAASLQGYRDGDRAHLTMHSQASSLSDQDIADIAAYYAAQTSTSKNNPDK